MRNCRWNASAACKCSCSRCISCSGWLIRDEAEEAALPEEYEALLVPEDGMLRLLDLVEDELVLAVPAVPVDPGSVAVDRDWPVPEEELAKANPFAGLASLKKN